MFDPNDEVTLSASDYAQMLDEIKNLHAECDRLTAMLGKPKVLEARKTCKWRFEDGWFWKTSCKNAFYLEDGTLGENRMAFCPFCGHKIEETP